jgi:hypothetical protein
MTDNIDDHTLKALADFNGEVQKVPRGQRSLPIAQPMNWRKAAANRKKRLGITPPPAKRSAAA